jgi:hypothetical protein
VSASATRALASIHEAGVSAGSKVGGAARIVLGLLYPPGYKKHITPQGAGVATGPVKFVFEALRRLVWTWRQVGWKIGPFACTYVCI